MALPKSSKSAGKDFLVGYARWRRYCSTSVLARPSSSSNSVSRLLPVVGQLEEKRTHLRGFRDPMRNHHAGHVLVAGAAGGSPDGAGANRLARRRRHCADSGPAFRRI